ncbi:hypothetical protein LTR85_000622 [Meristemomyces frigidus]|nr:hypothetical protein LTR85_000622 [Meristemomyces frigidus]
MAEEATNTSGSTANETKIVMCLVKHLKGELPSDFEAVAAELGYKDANVLKTRWSQIKRKKINAAGAANSEKSEKATPKKRKGKADGADEVDDEETAKKKRGRKSKADKAKEEDEAATAAGVKKEENEAEEANAVESTEKLEGDGSGMEA